MAVRCCVATRLRKAVCEALRVQNYQRDSEQDQNSTPALHFSSA
jgi:hypothetical protein